MKRSLRVVSSIVCGASMLFARSPQQLKADLATIMPAGKKAHLVWERGTVSGQYSPKILHVVDSDTGKIRTLPMPGAYDPANPYLTADGSRVFFVELNSGAIMVINFDGTGLRTVCNYGFVQEGWQDPTDKSDWAIITQGHAGSVSRVSLDAPLREVALTNLSVGGNGHPGLSPDGTHLAAWWGQPDGSWLPGTLNLQTGVVTNGSIGGCGLGIAPDDNTYDYFQHAACNYAAGHQGIMIENGSTVVKTICLTQSILAYEAATPGAHNGCPGANDEFHNAEWTNLRDYVTFKMFASSSNPYIVRLSDLKRVSIEDSLGCFHTDQLDVCFFTPSGTSTTNHQSRPGVLRGDDGRCETFGLDGRRIAVSDPRTHGQRSGGMVLIRRMQGRDRTMADVAPVP